MSTNEKIGRGSWPDSVRSAAEHRVNPATRYTELRHSRHSRHNLQESLKSRRFRRHPNPWKGRRRTFTATGPVMVRIGTAMLGIPRDRQIPGYASDIRDHRWAGPQSWLRSRILSLGRSRRGDEFSQTRSIRPNMAEETFGSPPGPTRIRTPPRDPSESRGCLRYRVSQMMLMICGPSGRE